MTIISEGETFYVCRFKLRADELPGLIQGFLQKYPKTLDIEAEAKRLAPADFPEDASVDFVGRVCRWGGYAGIGSRVAGSNTRQEIPSALRAAYGHLAIGRPVDGLNALLGLRQLGISFASKHLRFLAPDKAVILDKIISERLGYPLTLEGYREFLMDCGRLLDCLVKAGIRHPSRPENNLLVSDIEMAIYAKLRGF